MPRPLVHLHPEHIACAAGMRCRIIVATDADLDAVGAWSDWPPDTQLVTTAATFRQLVTQAGPRHPPVASIRVRAGDWRPLVDLHGAITAAGATCEARLGEIDPTTARLVISSGHPLRILIDSVEPDAAHRFEPIVDYYVREPAVMSHVEPIRALLTVAGPRGAPRRSPALWDLQFERLGHHLYIDRQGQVSLSPRWAARGKTFAQLTPSEPLSLTDLQCSTDYLDLQSYWHTLFCRRTRCATCPHFRLCVKWTPLSRQFSP